MPATPPPHTSRQSALNASQIEIWLEQSLHPDSTQFVLACDFVIPAAIDVERFLKATDWVLANNEALYGRLEQGPDGPPLLSFDPANAATCQLLDFSSECDPAAAALEDRERRARTPFQLLRAALCHCTLYKLGPARFRFLYCQHHILVDGWGTGVVFAHICQAYEALGAGLPPPPDNAAYSTYLSQSLASANTELSEAALSFWKPLLAAQTSALAERHAQLPGEHLFAVSKAAIMIPRALADQLSAQAQSSHATLYHVLLLAYSYLLQKQFSRDPLCLVLPTLNRGKKDKQTIGYFTETRTLPIPLEETKSVDENLQSIAHLIRNLFRHYHVPRTELTQLYQSQGNTGAPVDHGSLSYITRDFAMSLEGCPVQFENLSSIHSASPLCLYVLDIYPGQDIRLELLYQNRQLNPLEADQLLARLLFLLQQMAQAGTRQLCEFELVPPAERALMGAILDQSSKTVETPRPLVHELLLRSEEHPDSIAVIDGRRHCTYRELFRRARGLATRLVRDFSLQPGERVALLLPRGADLIASEIAAMLCGAAYIPIDTHTPELRARQICEEAQVSCLISNPAFEEKSRELCARRLIVKDDETLDQPFTPRTTLEQIAYILFTSGSTGKPKGVQISQRSLVEHLTSWRQTIPPLPRGQRCLFFHSPAFDISMESIYLPLLLGDTIVAAPQPQWTIFQFTQAIVANQLSVISLSPSFLLEYLKHLKQNPELRAELRLLRCMTGGETMHAETALLWDELFGNSAQLLNLYGPTEATVTSNIFIKPLGYRCEPGESVPLGPPHPGRRLRIVDPHGRAVPFGMEGELLISGIGLSDGYLQRPEETAQRFITLEDGNRYYRSGDLVRLKPDGNLIFVRRCDNQVKIRGFRVELDEIEACLLSHPEVNECAVIAALAKDGNSVLRAYLSLGTQAATDSHALRQYLQARLPSYMIPTITLLAQVPKGQTAKVDRKALHVLAQSEDAPPTESQIPCPPQGATQEYLCLLWEEALGKKVASIRTDFFELGGHSLLAATLIAKISRAFRVEYPLNAFFEKASVLEIDLKLEQLVGNRERLEAMAQLRLELARMSPEQIKQRLEQASRKAS